MSTKNTPTTTATEEAATNEQVGHINDLVAPRLRQLPREHAQTIITNGGAYQTAFSAMVETFILRMSNWIVLKIEVNRDRTPEEVISATNRKPYVKDEIVRTMPRRDGRTVEMVYFKPGPECYKDGMISEGAVVAEYDARDIEPDPYAQAADNEAHPEFADEHPNGCQWPLEGGGYGFLSFSEWGDGRSVGCGRCGGVGWGVGWLFGGVRKVSK
ncbi:MAG: hypothetical protein HYW51_02720 [Candidatus Doudnabacteria bacterium]|nr:hypothetical protein [Candidatus Doudnabacteria bacterium]